ncbi:MAG: ATP-binding cassette domain-containing protein [Methanohalobium sp.]|uniref:ATP-binding cassette domain-containing protein n=1 Tax=Methanohalobium sp. TaxID=2837493 RepID=UPI0039793745
MSIDVKGVNFSYNKNTSHENHVLKNINLTIDKNEFVGITGEIGSGKSTMVKLFNGLFIPDTGKVSVEGLDAADKKVRRKVGLLFQNPHDQLFAKTVFEDVAFAPSNFGITGDELTERVYESLQLVGIDKKLADISPFKLSGGEMRRVALAGILAMKPEYLILDEPTSGVDIKGKIELYNNLEKIHENGTCIIMITHQIDDLFPVANKIVLMNQGRIVFTGTSDEYLDSIDFPAPEITILMRELQKQGFDVRSNVSTVDDAYKEINRMWINTGRGK